MKHFIVTFKHYMFLSKMTIRFFFTKSKKSRVQYKILEKNSPHNAWYFLTTSEIVSFSKRIPFHAVNYLGNMRGKYY